MSVTEFYDDRLMAQLAAAADGTLPARRQAEIEADPALAAALDAQRRAMTRIREAAAEVEAPLALRERLEAGRARQARPRARRPWLSVALAGAAAAAVLLAAVLAAPGGPTVEEAAAFAARPAAGAAPATDGSRLAIAHDGVAFPAWADRFGWEATGTRTGEVDGRDVTTVYYAKGGRTLAYSIVGGEALGAPKGARTVTAAGTAVAVLRVDGTPVVTWERGGHTCVLRAAGVPDAELAALAGATAAY